MQIQQALAQIEVHKQFSALELEKRKYEESICKQTKAIPAMWVLFQSEHPETERMNTAIVKRQFLFIVLLIFSPRSLNGGKMRGGIRNLLATVLGCKPTSISGMCRNLLFEYRHYKDFREGVNCCFEKLARLVR